MDFKSNNFNFEQFIVERISAILNFLPLPSSVTHVGQMFDFFLNLNAKYRMAIGNDF